MKNKINANSKVIEIEHEELSKLVFKKIYFFLVFIIYKYQFIPEMNRNLNYFTRFLINSYSLFLKYQLWFDSSWETRNLSTCRGRRWMRSHLQRGRWLLGRRQVLLQWLRIPVQQPQRRGRTRTRGANSYSIWSASHQSTTSRAATNSPNFR